MFARARWTLATVLYASAEGCDYLSHDLKRGLTAFAMWLEGVADRLYPDYFERREALRASKR